MTGPRRQEGEGRLRRAWTAGGGIAVPAADDLRQWSGEPPGDHEPAARPLDAAPRGMAGTVRVVNRYRPDRRELARMRLLVQWLRLGVRPRDYRG